MSSHQGSRRRRRTSGLTIIEGIMALAVLEVAVLAVGAALAAGRMHAQEVNSTLHGIEAGEDLLETILALPYEDPDGLSDLGPEAGETSRDRFDNADDYDGFRDTVEWEERGEIHVLSRSVDVAFAEERIKQYGAAIPGIEVTVSVRNQAGTAWTVTRFIAEGRP